MHKNQLGTVRCCLCLAMQLQLWHLLADNLLHLLQFTTIAKVTNNITIQEVQSPVYGVDGILQGLWDLYIPLILGIIFFILPHSKMFW